MLDARVPIGDHGHVVLKERAALGHDHHLELTSGLEDLLALVSAMPLI